MLAIGRSFLSNGGAKHSSPSCARPSPFSSKLVPKKQSPISVNAKCLANSSLDRQHSLKHTLDCWAPSSASFTRRWYARPRKPTIPPPQQAYVSKKGSPATKKKPSYVEDEDESVEDLLNMKDDDSAYVGQPYKDEDVPMDVRQPMENFKLPKQKITFNYKTYRYKDLQINDPERITRSFTIPAAMGSQVRPGERLEPIIHTKDDLGEDLSKDEILFSNSAPIGLDGPVVPYASQMTAAIYDILTQEKAEDIVVINIDGKTNWIPTMIIVTAISPRHCVALANRVAAELKRSKLCRAPKIERNVGDEWVIVATGTTILEILTAENREYMDLERLWVLKKSAQETFEFDEEEERFMYDEEDGMWDDDDPDW